MGEYKSHRGRPKVEPEKRRSERIGVAVSSEVRSGLELIARSQSLTVSELVQRLLTDYVAENENTLAMIKAVNNAIDRRTKGISVNATSSVNIRIPK